jgi:hypothetical protein
VANTKYDHLIKPLNAGLTNWDDTSVMIGPGNASCEVRLNGRDHLEGLNLNFSWGVHTGLGDWHAGLDPHIHPYAECLLFVGLDTANVNYLGAQINCCLGEEQETYTFDEPTAVVVPAGLPHGPIFTKRMFSPRGFGFWAVELNSVSDITWLGEGVSKIPTGQREKAPEGLRFAAEEKILRNKPIEATGKYAHLVKSLRSGLLIERGKYNAERLSPEQLAQIDEKSRKGEKLGPGNPNHLALMGAKELEGLNASIFWGFCSTPGLWRRGAGAHVHPTNEIIAYVGTDPDDIGYLGAEIELDMGPEHERHLINKPSVVICPAGMPHTPQVTRWIDKPFGFFAVNLSGEHVTESFD